MVSALEKRKRETGDKKSWIGQTWSGVAVSLRCQGGHQWAGDMWANTWRRPGNEPWEHLGDGRARQRARQVQRGGQGPEHRGPCGPLWGLRFLHWVTGDTIGGFWPIFKSLCLLCWEQSAGGQGLKYRGYCNSPGGNSQRLGTGHKHGV